jgi:hypothetical protein
MPEQPQGLPDVQASLHAIARILREAHHLGPDARQALAEFVDELGRDLERGAVPPTETAHLAAGTAHLLQALHPRPNPGVLVGARERLEQAILNAETKAPFAAGLAQRLLDALANVGI